MQVPISKNIVISLVIGFIFGLSVSLLTISKTQYLPNYSKNILRSLQSQWSQYYTHPPYGHAHSHEDLEDEEGPPEIVMFHNGNESVHRDEDLVARQLAENVKVLCWVMTQPKNHKSKARHVKATWGRRCNKVLFMSSKEDEDLPTVKLKVGEGRDNLWGKTKNAFKHVYQNHFEEYDWFVKADDDTYMVIENLRYLLKDYNSSYPLYFGRKFKPYVDQGYMSGGAGYVLSKEALRRFVEDGVDDGELCRLNNGGAEDVEMGKCMLNLGVEAGDSRDSEGRKRFMPFVPEHHLIPGHIPQDSWYWKYQYYEEEEGLAACSDLAISFHYVSPKEMYVFEYLIYHLRPFGISSNSKPEDTKVEKL